MSEVVLDVGSECLDALLDASILRPVTLYYRAKVVNFEYGLKQLERVIPVLGFLNIGNLEEPLRECRIVWIQMCIP